MSDLCQRCGQAPRGVTHVCPPPDTMGHRCQPPTITGLTHPIQPDWTCGLCGRVWREQVAGALRYWAEVRGPSRV